MKIVQFENENTLFFVSGMFAGGWMWQEAYRHIDNFYTSYVMDDPLCKLGATVDELSEAIIKELDKIDRPVTLVGNSLGSYICLNVAATAPHKVKKVIISGSAGFGEITLPVRLSRHQPYAVAQKLMNLICYDKSKASHDSITKTSLNFDKYFKNIVGLIRESNAANTDELLSRLQCPVHAIWGRDDEITPLVDTLAIFKKFNINLTVINECGHSPMFENPDKFAELLEQCIAG